MNRRSILGLPIAALVLLAGTLAVPAHADTAYLRNAQTGLLGQTFAVAAAPTGGVYVTAQSGIARVAADGRSAQPFLPLENARGVAVDTVGDVYVSPDRSPENGGITKYSAGGALLWDSPGYAFDSGSLSVAGGVVWFTGYGSIYGLDASDGRLLHEFTVGKTSDIAALPSGNVLVGYDRITGGLGEYTPSGSLVRTVPDLLRYFAVAADGTIVGNEFKTDGSQATRVIALHPTGTTSSAHIGGSGAYFHDYAVDSDGVVWAVSVPGDAQLVRLDPQTPDARLTGVAAIPGGGVFDATTSTVPFGEVTRYEWDLDRDGTFELDTESDGTLEYVFPPAPGMERVVSVRVTSDRGGTATAQVAILVASSSTPPPPAPQPQPEVPAGEPAPIPDPGPVGVSINGGDQYTNDPDVVIVARWPVGYRRVMVSNDGGFVPSVQGPIAGEIAWQLDASGPERLPKTIYVRFLDGSRVSETYQDDIILDQTKPTITQAAALSSRMSSRTVMTTLGRAAVREFIVRTKAVDKTSGVRKMQITGNKKRPGKWITYKKSRTFRTASTRIFVRVRDGATNVSGWKRLR